MQKKIRELIPAYASARNPIDMTPIWPKFVDLYSKCIQILYESSEVDIIVPIILQRAAMMPEVCTAVADTVNDCLTRGIRKPTYVCWVSVRDALKNMDLLQSKHVPCFDWPERTAGAVAAISGYAEFLKRRDVSLEGR